MASTAATRHSLVANFTARERDLGARGPGWAAVLRRAGLARFEELGFPTTSIEAWRQTSLARLEATEFVPAAPGGAPAPALLAAADTPLGGTRLVFVDGSLRPELSTATRNNGLWVGSLSAALAAVPNRLRPFLARRDPAALEPFEALNTAFHEDGAVVLVPEGVDVGPPVHVIHLTTGGERPTASHPRTLVAAGRGSRVCVVETHVGTSGSVYLTNAVTDLDAGDDASLAHFRVQLESERAFHLSTLHTRQSRDSRLGLHAIDLGGQLVRNHVVAVLDGPGADCQMNGLYVTRGEQHVDNQTVLDHAQPHGASRELYKGILDGRSRTVFNGRIVVRRDAQKTDAKQSNRNLLLSAGALAQTRPQLEIYADDVKCTHGATIGRLDEEAVFYLRSRGLSDLAARNLMIAAFIGEVLERVEIGPLRTTLEREVAGRLPRAAGDGQHE